MTEPNEPNEEALKLIAEFTAFLADFGNSGEEARRGFLEFIGPQTRRDIINLADALRARETKEEEGVEPPSDE